MGSFRNTFKNINWKFMTFFTIWMYVIMTFVFPYLFDEKVTLERILIGIPIWIVAGYAVAYFNYRQKIKQ